MDGINHTIPVKGVVHAKDPNAETAVCQGHATDHSGVTHVGDSKNPNAETDVTQGDGKNPNADTDVTHGDGKNPNADTDVTQGDGKNSNADTNVIEGHPKDHADVTIVITTLDSANNDIRRLVEEASAIQTASDEAVAHSRSLEDSLAKLEAERGRLLEQDAATAVDALVELIKQIESLHQFIQDQKSSSVSAIEASRARAPLVNACKSRCQAVHDHFQSLYDNAKELMNKFIELSTEFTHETSSAQTRIENLSNLEKRANVFMKGVNEGRKTLEEQKIMAEHNIEQARAARRSAEDKMRSLEERRRLGDYLPFGLGELMNMLTNLEGDIKNANRIIWSAEENLKECMQLMDRTESTLGQVEEEIISLNRFRSSINDQESRLQESVVHNNELRMHTNDLTNSSLDLSLFLGKLASKSETLGINDTAQQFAKGVLSFAKLMVSEEKLNGLLLQRDPGALQETLEMIAQSDGKDGNGGDMM